MAVGEIVACLASAMAGCGVGVVVSGLLAAGHRDDLHRQLDRLSDDDARRRDKVARLTEELAHCRLRDEGRQHPGRAAAAH